jgi:hypothetical protein
LVGGDQFLLNFSQGFGVGHAGHGHADEFAANFMEPSNSSDGAVDIKGVFVDHGLDDDGMSAAQDDVTHGNRTGFTTGNGGIGQGPGILDGGGVG